MAELWSLRGLSCREWVKRTCRRSWEDEVFGQAARLAFYYFFGIFPALLLLLLLLKALASTGSELHNTLLDSFQQIVPREASALIAKTIHELKARAALGIAALWAVLSAAWAILNGTWAMMAGLNKAYGVKEERPGVEDFDHRFRTDNFAGDHGPGGASGDALWQPSRDGYQSAFWLLYSPCFLADHAVDGDSNTAPLLVRVGLSLRAKLKRPKVAMEYTGCGCSDRVVGQFYTAVSNL
jgi:hypothetical protein